MSKENEVFVQAIEAGINAISTDGSYTDADRTIAALKRIADLATEKIVELALAHHVEVYFDGKTLNVEDPNNWDSSNCEWETSAYTPLTDMGYARGEWVSSSAFC